MNRELRIEGIFYLPMLPEESEEQAVERFEELLSKDGIMINDDCITYEAQEV